jgi:mannitol-1-phosphate/altronate dehydrogenase
MMDHIDMGMPRLHPDMMARYEIEYHRPARINAVQFGMSEALLGTVDRLIDDARSGIGIACVEADASGHARRLTAQQGLYTVLIRGYAGEEAVRREQVVQCVLSARGPEEIGALAADPAIELALADDTPAARALASRFDDLRR